MSLYGPAVSGGTLQAGGWWSGRTGTELEEAELDAGMVIFEAAGRSEEGAEGGGVGNDWVSASSRLLPVSVG